MARRNFGMVTRVVFNTVIVAAKWLPGVPREW